MIKAILIKRKTEDGLMEMEDDIELGKEYMIHPAERIMGGYNFKENKKWVRKMVLLDDGTWFASELLDWEGKTKPS